MLHAMIRPLLALAAFSSIAAPAGAQDRHFQVADFDRVIVEGPYAVHLVTGRPSAALGRGPREALDRLSVDVQGMTLRIRRSRTAWVGEAGSRASGTVTLELATRTLRSARLIGPARLDVEGMRGPNIELSVEGSGTLRATRLDADSLSLALLGSGSIAVAGAARTLAGNFQGTGELAAAGLVAHNATIASNTSGAVALTVNGPATVANLGLGTIRIYGRAVCATTGVSADQVRCGGAAPAPASNQSQPH
jgi:hypothetical protein